MKKEIYKLFVSPIFKIALVFTFLIIFFVAIYNSFSTTKPKIDILEQGVIELRYNSQEDISKHLQLAKEQLNNLDPTSISYEKTKEILIYRITLYEYLQENFIPYEQLVDSDVLSASPTKNFYSFHAKTLGYIMVFIIFFILILNYVIFSIDFDNSSYKYIYIKGNRKKLILNKSLLILASVIILIFLTCFIVSLYANVLYINEPQQIIFFQNGNLNIMNKGLFIFYNSLGLLVFAIAMQILITGIFIIFKKTIYSILIFSVYFIFLNSISSIVTNKYLVYLFILPIYAFNEQLLWLNLTYNICLSVLVYGIGIVRFLKKDL